MKPDSQTLLEPLVSKGYTIIEQKITDHSIWAVADLGENRHFFKSSLEIKHKIPIENELYWNKFILTQRIELPIVFPEVIDSGSNEYGCWFIRDYYRASKDVARVDDQYVDPSFVEEILPTTIKLLKVIPTLSVKMPIDELATDQSYYRDFYILHRGSNEEVRRLMMELANQCISNIHWDNAKEIILSTSLLAKEPLNEKLALSFVDYKPWHFLKVDKLLTLIDAEHVNNMTPRYFDIAFYYTQTALNLARIDIARMAVRQFIEGGVSSTFKEEFYSLVARVSLYLLRDAINDKSVGPQHEETFKNLATKNLY